MVREGWARSSDCLRFVDRGWTEKKPLERSAFGFFYGGKITSSHHLIKQKCCIWGSGSLWTERTDDQISKELHQNVLVLVQLYPGALRKNSEIIYGERLQRTHICVFSHLFYTFIFSAIDCFRPFHFSRWFFELIELLRKKTQGFPGDRRHDWELCRYVHKD